MKIQELEIKGAWVADSPIFNDERGFFREWFKSDVIKQETGIDFSVMQANISLSKKGAIRGLHYSLAPGGQAKWVTCITGKILDVIIDIRTTSSTFGEIEYVLLEAGSGRSVMIGEGLAHGFISLENQTSISYLLSSPYKPEHEFEIQPLDETLKIDWHLELIENTAITISQKDAHAPTFNERKAQGLLPREVKSYS